MNDFELWEKEISFCKKLNSNRVKFDKQIKISINENNCTDDSICDMDSFLKVNNDYKKTENTLDYNTYKKLKTGNYKIDKTVDFHGLTIDEAFDIFLKNINFAYSNNLRCLLFITGKGNNSKKDSETIKENFQKWIKLDFVFDKILKCIQAVNKDGGSGAFYILLRKNKYERN